MPIGHKECINECKFLSARVDIAGTWSDTPPICFEHGGAVVIMTAMIDGQVITIKLFIGTVL